MTPQAWHGDWHCCCRAAQCWLAQETLSSLLQDALQFHRQASSEVIGHARHVVHHAR